MYAEDNMAASRLAMLLLNVGYTNIKVLNGGLNNWSLNGYPTKGSLEKSTLDDSRGRDDLQNFSKGCNIDFETKNIKS